MYSESVLVMNDTGLHARPASEFTQTANLYESTITIQKKGVQDIINAKSIVKLLTQGINKGTEITISADGVDEVEAVQALVALIEGGFGEL